ncbi:MBL fold metallo-hydrolase [Candidatus Dojkabacteria bacterium]|uniref:MBL fold metallo-hydrolase n=1 Tax=Candidatus Dojkabacteria bacterium TaxID=2099670 RepID=A0A955L4Z0_9BACT|nr:MBL fold metallo-hydrolase [Candidatus Dojkabacteria bacterium]
MDIRYLGHSSYQIKTKTGTIVCDPFTSKDPQLGLKFPRGIVADVVTISHDHADHNGVVGVEGQPFILKEPGEYEIKEINFFGIQSFHDEKEGQERGMNTIFLIEAEGISVCHLGDLGHTLTSDQVNELNEVDILMIPVGGTYTLDAKKATEVVNQIEPKIVIPMHYQDGDAQLSLANVELFYQEMGKEKKEALDKLSIKESDLVEEEPQIVLLNKRN